MDQAAVVRILEASRGGTVRVRFVDGEETLTQVLFVDDHVYFAFCHRIIATNRPDKHGGAYRPDTSWLAPLARVVDVEPVPDGKPPWGSPAATPPASQERP